MGRLDHSDNAKMIVLSAKGKPPAKHISFQVLTGCNHQRESSAAPPFLPRNNLTSNMLRLPSTWMHACLDPGYKGRSVFQTFFETSDLGIIDLGEIKLLPSENVLSFKPRGLERPSRGICPFPNSRPAATMSIW